MQALKFLKGLPLAPRKRPARARQELIKADASGACLISAEWELTRSAVHPARGSPTMTDEQLLRYSRHILLPEMRG